MNLTSCRKKGKTMRYKGNRIYTGKEYKKGENVKIFKDPYKTQQGVCFLNILSSRQESI